MPSVPILREKSAECLNSAKGVGRLSSRSQGFGVPHPWASAITIITLGAAMGFKQTDKHRFGKGSYHQIGLVRGQFGNVEMNGWVKFVADTGFDGWEEASWELDLNRCAAESGAE